MAGSFFKSIRFKIVCWYTIFLLITLSAFSALLYGSFRAAIYGELDDLLASRADGIADSITAYRHARLSSAQAGNEKGDILNDADDKNFITLANNWVEEKRKEQQLMSIYAQILNAKEEVVVASKSIPLFTQLPKEDLEDILDGDDSFDTVIWKTGRNKQTKLRLYSRPVLEGENVKYIVQVLAPAVGLLFIALNNLKIILFILLPLTVLLASIPGVILVRLTLKPVDRMIDTLRQITAENLKLRIHIPDTKDEVKKLADTFNGMIDRLDRSFSSQQRFIQEISNKLKVPMMALKEEITRSLAKDNGGKEYVSSLNRISEGIEDFSRAVEDLTVLSRLESEEAAFEIRRVNLTHLIEDALKDIKPKAEEKDITISLSSPQTIILDGNKEQLQKLFASLLENAVKYTYRQGHITFMAHKSGKCARISVSDTGIGIPQDEKDYIFDRFYQVTTPRSSTRGFGLGLSTAKMITEAHKGTISLESEYGKGSTFTVTLPLSYPG